MAMETKNRKEQTPKFYKEIEAVLKKELPKLLKQAYKQNLSKERAIEISKQTMEQRKADLTASYVLDILKEIGLTEDIDKIKELETLYLRDYKFLNDFETRLIDYIDKNYKPNKSSEVKNGKQKRI
jgi:hypothetical protein